MAVVGAFGIAACDTTDPVNPVAVSGSSASATSATSTTSTTSASSSGSGTGGEGGAGSATSAMSSSASSGPGGGAGGSGGAAPVDPLLDSEILFEEKEVPTFLITLPQASIDILNVSPKTYVHGDLSLMVAGQKFTLNDVGIRLKGTYGSFRDLSQKAAFLIKVSEYKSSQRLFGLKKFALNNMVQDPSLIHERTGYSLFRAVDVPAPRAAHANVVVNGQLYGLYTTVEANDNPPFQKHWFGASGSQIYEGAYGVDLNGGYMGFDLDAGNNVANTDVKALVDALDAMVDPATFLTDASKVIDMDRYVKFMATELYLGHWDGYNIGANNYYIAQRTDDQRWTFLPWGLDQTFGSHLDPFGANARLGQMCLASQPCRDALAAAYETILAKAAELDLATIATTAETLVHPFAEADPKREYDVPTIDAYFQATLDFIASRPGEIMSGLMCADPSQVDADMDGHSWCNGGDCDDNNPNIYPGAVDICGNLVDEDCSGVPDDGPGCPCPSVPAPWGSGTIAFCLSPMTWPDAEADCIAQGGHLVSIHDQATQDFITNSGNGIVGSEWWIGATDAAMEGTFAWIDGTPLDYQSWNGGEPNNWGGNENCAMLLGGSTLWNDADCAGGRRYICALP